MALYAKSLARLFPFYVSLFRDRLIDTWLAQPGKGRSASTAEITCESIQKSKNLAVWQSGFCMNSKLTGNRKNWKRKLHAMERFCSYSILFVVSRGLSSSYVLRHVWQSGGGCVRQQVVGRGLDRRQWKASLWKCYILWTLWLRKWTEFLQYGPMHNHRWDREHWSWHIHSRVANRNSIVAMWGSSHLHKFSRCWLFFRRNPAPSERSLSEIFFSRSQIKTYQQEDQSLALQKLRVHGRIWFAFEDESWRWRWEESVFDRLESRFVKSIGKLQFGA